MATLKLTLEYDGTDFVGWQYQLNGRSVQEEIEKVLHQLLQENIRIMGGGRTDAGVHARGQVAHFSTNTNMDLQRFKKSVNGMLPRDIALQNVELVSSDFHARYSATKRRYRYFIRRGLTAIERKYCWEIFCPLDIKKMHACAEIILGEHDFQSFCKKQAEVDHYSCQVVQSQWQEKGEQLIYVIEANRFLYSMVRTLVGTMIDVGRGATPQDEFIDILNGRNRGLAGCAAPAKGLFLEEIVY
jgi:tRNA pseudouridine38-40 synthase